jgi:formate dehydrogenase assembly factor FdhD
MLGSIIFNYAFIVMVPSWINEKRAEVSVNRSHFTLLYFVTLLYSACGKCAEASVNRSPRREKRQKKNTKKMKKEQTHHCLDAPTGH